jgi:type IV secretory pathway VirB6-like protein
MATDSTKRQTLTPLRKVTFYSVLSIPKELIVKKSILSISFVLGLSLVSFSQASFAQQTTTRSGPNGNTQTTTRAAGNGQQTTTRTAPNGNTQTTTRTAGNGQQTTTRTGPSGNTQTTTRTRR